MFEDGPQRRWGGGRFDNENRRRHDDEEDRRQHDMEGGRRQHDDDHSRKQDEGGRRRHDVEEEHREEVRDNGDQPPAKKSRWGNQSPSQRNQNEENREEPQERNNAQFEDVHKGHDAGGDVTPLRDEVVTENSSQVEDRSSQEHAPGDDQDKAPEEAVPAE